MNRYRLLTVCSALLLVAGCSPAGTYDVLKEKAPEAGNFSTSLAAEYLAYAESQADLGNVADADYFAAKGLKALNEGFVEPEDVGMFAGEQKPRLQAAKEALMKLLSENVRRVLPQQAARTQLLYDCWYHQASQVKIGNEAPCEGEFKVAFEELEDVSESFIYTHTRRYLLTFTGSHTELTDAMNNELDTLAGLVSGMQLCKLELHAVPQGRGQAHDDIAEKRATRVREALIAKGIRPGQIEIHDDTTAKTVYLSNDQEAQPKNTVAITIKAAEPIKGGEEE